MQAIRTLSLCRGSACTQARRVNRSRQLSVAVAASAKPGKDVLLRSMSEAAEVQVLVLDGTQLVAEAARRHQTAPTATAALGRALMGAVLMGAFRKDDEQIQITFKGDGPIESLMVIANTTGCVKGRIGNPNADPPLRPDGKLNVGEAVGLGVLAVVRSHPADKQPYTGMVPIVSGEVAEDLANYLVDSEQTNSALGLGVSLDRECAVRAAGGWLVQILPFCSEETLTQLEINLGTMPSVTTMLNNGLSAQDIANRILEGLGQAPDPCTLTPTYGPCEPAGVKDRMLRAIGVLGPAEVRGILAEQGKVEVTCEFCCESYRFGEDDLSSILTVV